MAKNIKTVCGENAIAVVTFNEQTHEATYQVYPVLKHPLEDKYFAPLFPAPLQCKAFKNVSSLNDIKDMMIERIVSAKLVDTMDPEVKLLQWRDQNIATIVYNGGSMTYNVIAYGNCGHYIYIDIAPGEDGAEYFEAIDGEIYNCNIVYVPQDRVHR